jgi:hypothetical protein
MIYHPLDQLCNLLKVVWRGHWSPIFKVLPASLVIDLIGVWSREGRVYVLRKHPGLLWLNKEERTGQEGDEIEN